MFFFLSKILDILLSPYTWGLALLAAAVPWRARAARRWRRRRGLGIAGLVLLLFASAMPVANSLTWSIEHAAVSTLKPDVTYDAVVLLGGIVEEAVTQESGQPAYNENVERVIMTHRLLRDGKAKVVIVSGGTMDPRYAASGEAVQLARQLEDWGIPKERIIVEDKSRNTRENAVFSREIARARGFERVIIVTSAFHMPRAADCFRAVGMDVDVLPVDYRARANAPGGFEWMPRANALAITSAMTREVLGRLIYRAQGYGKGP